MYGLPPPQACRSADGVAEMERPISRYAKWLCTDVEPSHALVMDTVHVVQRSELPVEVQAEIPESGLLLSLKTALLVFIGGVPAETRAQPFALIRPISAVDTWVTRTGSPLFKNNGATTTTSVCARGTMWMECNWLSIEITRSTIWHIRSSNNIGGEGSRATGRC